MSLHDKFTGNVTRSSYMNVKLLNLIQFVQNQNILHLSITTLLKEEV